MLNDKHTPLQSNTVENKKLHEELRLLPQGLACEGQKHKKLLCLWTLITTHMMKYKHIKEEHLTSG